MSANTTEQFKEMVKERLHQGPAKIEFEKKDGTIREMICTLNFDLIQQNDAVPVSMTNDDPKELHNAEVQPVLDLEKGEWRSFRWDSVLRVDYDV